MRIVHCLIHYLPEQVAGTEIYAHTLARLQQDAGHEVSVITPHIEAHRPGQIEFHYRYESVDVYQYLETSDPNDRDYYQGRKRPQGLLNFSELFHRLKPEIAHFHQLNRGVGLSIEHVKIARSSGAKVFVTMHLSFYTCNTNMLIYRNRLCDGMINHIHCSACSLHRLYDLPYGLAVSMARLGNLTGKIGLNRLIGNNRLHTMLSFPDVIRRMHVELDELCRHANQIICIADWYKEVLLKNGVPANKLTFIPQALADITIVNSTNSEPPKCSLPLRLVFIGRIQWQKGLHLLIEACSRFTENEVLLDIYGKPEQSEYYHNCVSASSGKTHINWRGSINRAEIINTLSGYDLLCLPSVFSEMSPLVIQEAFMAGIPVLASRVYGNMEQIREGENGFLFAFNSAGDMADRIKQLVHDTSKILAIKRLVKPPLSFSVLAKKHIELYENC